MFCKNCGKKLPGDAKFCPACGAPVLGPPKAESFGSDNPVLVLKPVFVPWVVVLSILPLQIFFTLWGAGFCSGFSLVGLQMLGWEDVAPRWFPFVFFGGLFFFGLPLVVYFVKKKTYERTEYRFFTDHLEYYEGFFNVEQKSMPYKNVTEVYLRKGIIQSMYGLGTIVLSTPATGMQSGVARSGIQVSDIPNPDEVYRQVKELVGRAG